MRSSNMGGRQMMALYFNVWYLGVILPVLAYMVLQARLQITVRQWLNECIIIYYNGRRMGKYYRRNTVIVDLKKLTIKKY